ncbi:MAG: stage II sporulation protein M [Nanoarchaeota archaeon]
MKNGKMKNVNVIKKNIDDAFEYVRESRNYIYVVIGFFIFFVIVGFFIVPLNTELSEMLDKSLRDILLRAEGLSGLRLILFIFVNNVTVAFAGIFFGILLGIYPLFSSIVNGAVLGYVFAKVNALSGISQFWKILPHGIFELPAVFISLGIGLKLGTFIFSKNVGHEVKYRFVNSIKVFLFIIIPLLIVAAVIESFLILLFK